MNFVEEIIPLVLQLISFILPFVLTSNFKVFLIFAMYRQRGSSVSPIFFSEKQIFDGRLFWNMFFAEKITGYISMFFLRKNAMII